MENIKYVVMRADQGLIRPVLVASSKRRAQLEAAEREAKVRSSHWVESVTEYSESP